MRKVIFVLIFLISTICTVNAATYAKVAPYHGYLSNTNPQIYGDAWGWDYFSGGHATKFTQTGTLRDLQFYAQNADRLTWMQLKIWRQDQSTGFFNLISTSGNLATGIHNGLNVIDLTSANISVQEGDSFSLYLGGTGDWSHSIISVTSSSSDKIAYVRYANYPGTNQVDWYTMQTMGSLAGYNGSMSVQFDMISPDIVCIGDSITAGNPNSEAFIDQYTTVSMFPVYPSRTFPYKLAGLMNASFQNMGMTGDTTTNILNNRLTPDAINKRPKYIVLEGGVNDLAQGVSSDTITNNIKAEIVAVQNAGITPIVVLILPTNGYLTNSQNLLADTVNNNIITYQSTNENFIIADARGSLGTYSAVQGWRTNQSYIAPADSVHLNEAGNAVLANVIYNSILNSVSSKTIIIYPNQSISIYIQGNPATVNWYINGKLVDTVSASAYSKQFTTPGYYNLTAVPVFLNGSLGAPIRYNVNVLRQMANSSYTFEQINTVGMNKIEQDIVTLNTSGTMEDIPVPFTNLIGNMFYAFIFALPMFFIWINQRKLTMPTTLFLLFGWLVIGLVPPQFHYVIWIAIVVSFSVPFLKFIHPN